MQFARDSPRWATPSSPRSCRSERVPHHAANDRHDRGRGAVAVGAAARSRRDGRVGMMGISFAGGLSIVAASRPSLRDRVAFVLSFGGHGDLPRTLRYLCTGMPGGRHAPPAARLRRRDHPARRRGSDGAGRAGRAAARRRSWRSSTRRTSTWSTRRRRGANSRARGRLADGLPEPARTLMDYVNDARRRAARPVAAAARRGARRRRGAVAVEAPRRRRRRSTCCTAPTTTSSRRWSRRCSPRRCAAAASRSSSSRRR